MRAQIQHPHAGLHQGKHKPKRRLVDKLPGGYRALNLVVGLALTHEGNLERDRIVYVQRSKLHIFLPVRTAQAILPQPGSWQKSIPIIPSPADLATPTRISTYSSNLNLTFGSQNS
jgi:hypothetical protein